MQDQAIGVEALHHAHVGDIKITTKFQATLQWTLSTSSLLEMRVCQAEEQQAQARIVVEEAKGANKRAVL